VDRDDRTVPLTVQADLLGLSRASLYYRPRSPRPDTVALYHRIDELYTATPFYGSRRMTAVLRQEGWSVNRKRVQHAMRAMGLRGLAPGPDTSRPHPAHRIYPYLLRGVTAAYPNHVWGIDITYIRLRGTWLYLVAVLDWFSRYVVSWELSESLSLPFVLVAAERALGQATPVIWNHDQGSQFTSLPYTAILEAAGIQISMDGRGRALDNIFTERFWRSLKYEEVYLNDYRSPREARQGVERYMVFYNTVRPHQALGYQTPAAVYALPRPEAVG
jgi:putative transposase